MPSEDIIKNLETISQFTTDLQQKENDKNRKNIVESMINTLTKRLDSPPPEVFQLRQDANSLNRIADILDRFANDKANKDKKTLKEEVVEDIKKVLLEALGIRAAYVDILLKGSPEEIRGAVETIRKEAEKKEEQADLIRIEDREHKLSQINTLKTMSVKAIDKHMDQVAMNQFITLQREIMRAEADRPIKELCEEMEGKCSHGM